MSQFALEEFERHGDRLRVSGRWTDVRGMRFMRPTLTVGDRRVLAVLDHKPWMPEEGEPWIAEFPWDGDAADIDLTLAELAVAPSVAVPLSSPGEPVEPLGPPEPDPRALEEERRHRSEAEIAFLREQIDLLKDRLEQTERERDEARAATAVGVGAPAEVPAPAPAAEPEDDARVAKLEAAVERALSERDTARERLDDERERVAAARSAYDNARMERDAASHELARLRDELESRRVELPDEPALGTVTVPAPPAAPIERDEPAPFVKALEVWIPRAALAVFAICVLLLVVGAVKIF